MSFSYPCMVWFQQWMLLWGRLLQWLRCWSLLDGRALKNREILLPQMSHSWQLTCVILHCNITHTAGFAMHTDTDIVCYKTKKFNMYFSINSHFFCTWTNIWFSVIIKGALLMKLDHCDSCVAELKQQLTLKWCLSTSKALLFFFVFPPIFLWVSRWLAPSPPRKKVPNLKLEDGCGRSVCLHVCESAC